MTTPATAVVSKPRTGGRTQQGSGAAFQSRPRTGGRTQQGSQARRTGGRTQQGTQGGRHVKPGPVGQQRAAQPQQGGTQRRQRKPPPVRVNIQQESGRTSYQAVILGEFVAAILLVAATPFAKKDAPGVSPYAGTDLLQLVALTLTYFLLALVSGANSKAGRFAAWFGALILLTVGLAEAARLAKLLNVFGLQPAPTATEMSGTMSGDVQNG